MSDWPDSTAPPSATPHDARRWLWSAPQRRTLALLVLFATAWLGIVLWSRPATIGDPPPSHPAHFDDLRDRLDPNTASAAELAVLPGIGPAKADAIVQFRSAQRPPAFRSAADLTKVRGIGEITAAKLAPYLHFEEPPEMAAGQSRGEHAAGPE